jgi:hypothetical protein
MQGKFIWKVVVKDSTIFLGAQQRTLMVYTDKHDAAKASSKGLGWAKRRRSQFKSPRVVSIDYVGQIDI